MGGGPEIVPPPVRAGNQRPPGWLLQVATALPVLLQAAVLSRTNETQMARKSRLVLFVAALALALASVPLALGAAATATASISGLQLNYLPSPALGVDKMRARFSWVLPAQRDQPAQATCRVIVSTGNNTVAFDSGDDHAFGEGESGGAERGEQRLADGHRRRRPAAVGQAQSWR